MRESLRNVDTGNDSVANVITSLDKSHLLRPDMAGMETKTKKAAYVKILEQPASKGLRFRYECEGRSAGSIPGVSSTQDNKTFPTIQVIGYTGKAVVVVSCVTNEAPYKSHPHNLVGKEGCKKGVCTIHMNDDMTASFPNLGIQCVKKKDIDESLTLRQQIRVDPFQSGFAHKTSAQSIDLNCVRLAFQVFLEGNEKGAFTFALKPVVSDPIYDRKAKCDLTICRLTETSGPVNGGKEILLFCDKINKDDIQVRFYEEKGDNVTWEGFGDFQPSDVHKQYGICFRTPRYTNIEIEQPVQVQIQLRRPSDGAVSESRTFEFLPLDPGRAYWSAKKMKMNYNLCSQILSRDQALRGETGHQPQPPQQPPLHQELKHKVPLSRAPVMAGVFSAPEASSLNPEVNNGAEAGFVTQQRQTLRPVAMPGAASVVTNGMNTQQPQPAVSFPAAPAAASQQPPQVPARAGGMQKSSLFDPASVRPNSDMSIMSDFSSLTQCDNISMATRQSVNEILSMADVSVFSGDTINLDNISVNTLLNNPLGMQQPLDQPQENIEIKEEPLEAAINNSINNLSQSVATGLGSLTSVATVKENKQEVPQGFSVTPMDVTDITSESPGMTMEDLDIGQIYDDVMQCVYDDVDIKYDDVTLLMDQPPVPPTRRRETNIDADIPDIPDIDKPLPAAPRNNILTKLTGKKNEMLIAREKELERKKKEKEELEEQRRKEREEKERKKKEEREAKKREEDEKKAKLDEQKIKSSLFQRLFQRSQSRSAEAGDVMEDGQDYVMVTEEAASEANNGDFPPVPQHQGYMSQASMDARLSELEQLINSSNTGAEAGEVNLENNIVPEFPRQPEPGSAEAGQSQPVHS